MSQFNNNARVVNGLVIETCTDAALATHVPSLQATFIACPSAVQSMWTFVSPDSWSPPSEPTPAPVPVAYSLLSPMAFYLAFTPTERMKIKALASVSGVPAGSSLFGNAAAIPQDPLIAEFWATYELATQENSQVNPNLNSIQEGLAYLANPSAPTPAIITNSRIPQISAGIPQ
jgi:hypothetical protein